MMKRQHRQTGEINEMQIPAVSEKHEDKHSTGQQYRAPQVFLVGKAQRLIAGMTTGKYKDGSGFAWVP
ncbi:MAG TPA: hypothetical protein VFV38_06715 [Ktedonobacteraceae bacterium]|nr:hypothetical protein [Ktedonobacteraceae bacterium]